MGHHQRFQIAGTFTSADLELLMSLQNVVSIEEDGYTRPDHRYPAISFKIPRGFLIYGVL